MFDPRGSPGSFQEKEPMSVCRPGNHLRPKSQRGCQPQILPAKTTKIDDSCREPPLEVCCPVPIAA